MREGGREGGVEGGRNGGREEWREGEEKTDRERKTDKLATTCTTHSGSSNHTHKQYPLTHMTVT